MTLEEEIKHIEELVEEYKKQTKVYENIDEDRSLFKEEETECILRAEEYCQLLEWLKDLKQLKDQEPEYAIDKQALLDCLKATKLKQSKKFDLIIEIRNEILSLPPVRPQQKIGHWIRVDKDKLKCSKCEVIHFIAQYPSAKINYCPNCGIRMDSDLMGVEIQVDNLEDLRRLMCDNDISVAEVEQEVSAEGSEIKSKSFND